ncbi:MAG: hypothetical protein AXA67_08140 [Methylothermaceae bacteria B42]|nr:MAG: hypothetical protein AXA67_08140 [Methylothermaceae bacteria B42]
MLRTVIPREFSNEVSGLARNLVIDSRARCPFPDLPPQAGEGATDHSWNPLSLWERGWGEGVPVFLSQVLAAWMAAIKISRMS